MAEASPPSCQESFVLRSSDVYEYTVPEACRFSRQVPTAVGRGGVVRQGDERVGLWHIRLRNRNDRAPCECECSGAFQPCQLLIRRALPCDALARAKRKAKEREKATTASTHDTGAVDWADLPERLHFIVDMFRCYQEWPDLFVAPFTPEQVVALKAGHLPPGRL